jgi:hypothetical protein
MPRLVLGSFAAWTLVTILAPRAITAVEPFTPVASVLALGTFLDSILVAAVHIFFTVDLVVHFVVALTTLVFEAGAVLAQHAEIVIGELQVIFGLDAVAGELRVARHALVFFEQLGGVPALAIVLPVARLTAHILATLSPASAAASTLSTVDQIPTSLRSVSMPLRFEPGRAAP